jgi:hypothetical protein
MRPSKLKLLITSNDIAAIENCSSRTATQKINDMKVFYKKREKRHKITFSEYSKYTDIPLEELEPYR